MPAADRVGLLLSGFLWRAAQAVNPAFRQAVF